VLLKTAYVRFRQGVKPKQFKNFGGVFANKTIGKQGKALLSRFGSGFSA
jgi:hypothetical protein